MSPEETEFRPLIMAVPKGRILGELMPLLSHAGIVPEADFANEESRKLRFKTNDQALDIIRVRSFDVVTFVAFGGAQLGVTGDDVLSEFNYSEIYSPLDLGIGKCHLSLAEPAEMAPNDHPATWSHVRIATKYPEITKRHFAARGVHAECVKLNGALELAPSLGLSSRIVDLVSTGATLKANGLIEVERILDVTSRLVVNRTAMKTRADDMATWIDRFKEAVRAKAS